MNRTTTITLAAIAVLIVVGVVLFNGGTRTGARTFEKEPQVSLTDKETGETRTLTMEEYVQGVVAGEMGQLPAEGGEEGDWPQEAYAAQAILARSFALSFLTGEENVEITNDVLEAQAYRPENITPAIRRAVEGTRGQVMVNQGDYVKAWFHSYSGGRTATAKEGLNYQEDEPDFIRSADLPENEFAPEDHRSWTASIPLSRVSEALRERGIDVGEVTNVTITETGPSGRATGLDVTGDEGTRQVHGADFRVAVGAETMKSTRLDEMRVEGGSLVMRGSGFGHGVGLSQWDAYKMAKEGKSAEEIMNAFFKNITIEKVWD